jgi:signal transduction histidine kinase/DNA-binding response OmpR family regulator
LGGKCISGCSLVPILACCVNLHYFVGKLVSAIPHFDLIPVSFSALTHTDQIRSHMMRCLIFTFFKREYCVPAILMLSGWLFCGNVFAQKTQADTLKHELKLHRTEDTVRVNLFIQLSRYYFGVDQNQSQINGEAALKLAEKLSFHRGIAAAKIWLAMNYHMIGQSEAAIRHALSAEAIAEKYGFPGLLAESNRTLAFIYTNLEDLDKAESYYLKGVEHARISKDFGLQARILNGLGDVEMRKKKHSEGLKLFFQSLAIAREHPMPFYLPVILSNIGVTYGTSFNNRALQQKYFKEGLAAARKISNRYAEATILANMGQMFTKMGKYHDAEICLYQSLKINKETGIKNGTQTVYLKLVELSMKQNDFPKATKYIDEYYDLRNSLLNEEKNKQIAQLEEQFKSEKREQKIQLLEQEKRLQIASKNFWIIGSVLLFIATVIIYYLQQSRNRKSRQLLDVQKTLIDQLEETDLLKSRFFANISHEFRTPLSLILAPVEEMLNSAKPSIYDHKDLKMVKRNANRLLDLVNQLLDLSKLEAGKMSLQIQQGNLQEWLRILAASFDSLAEAKKITFITHFEIARQEAWFDRDKLEKIISNILSNAFKFTKAGGNVTLSMRTSEDASDLLVTLADTGIGISQEDLPHVFSPFYQARRTLDDGQPGTGLGLAMVNELVKLHRGKLDLTSQPTAGTTIEITLPISREKLNFAEELVPDREPVISKRTSRPHYITANVEPNSQAEDCILIVEDNAELRNFIANVFHDQFKVITANDGQEGLQTAIELMPDLIISDVMMPRMDGIELTENIREHELTSHIPVLLLTAKSDQESRMDGLRTGADDYLAKPFSTEELRVRVTNLILLRKKLAAKYRNEIMNGTSEERIPSSDDKFVISLRAVINAHMGNASFSVEQLAEEMCLSRTQLFRKVKALLDISPNELINDIRLQRAAVLIRSKADSLTQISYSVGFSEQSYFAKRFRKKYGVSPSEYANT